MPVVKIGLKTIELEDSVNLLGINLDQYLEWNVHIREVENKISRGLYALNANKNLLSIPALQLIYFSLIHSHLTYGLLLWGGASRTKLNSIFIKQKKALRCVFQQKYNSHTNPLFIKLNCLKLEDLFKLDCLKMIHRYMFNSLPNGLRQFFLDTANVHEHRTRQSGDPHIQRFAFKQEPKASDTVVNGN